MAVAVDNKMCETVAEEDGGDPKMYRDPIESSGCSSLSVSICNDTAASLETGTATVCTKMMTISDPASQMINHPPPPASPPAIKSSRSVMTGDPTGGQAAATSTNSNAATTEDIVSGEVVDSVLPQTDDCTKMETGTESLVIKNKGEAETSAFVKKTYGKCDVEEEHDTAVSLETSARESGSEVIIVMSLCDYKQASNVQSSIGLFVKFYCYETL